MRETFCITITIFTLLGFTEPLNAQSEWRYFRKFDPYTFQFQEEVIWDTISEPCLKVRYVDGIPTFYKNLVDYGHCVTWAKPRNFYYANGFSMIADTIPAHGPDNFMHFDILGRDTLVSLEYISSKKYKKPKWRLFTASLKFESGARRTMFYYPQNTKWPLPTQETSSIKLNLAPPPDAIQNDGFTEVNGRPIRFSSYIGFDRSGRVNEIVHKILCLEESDSLAPRWVECEEYK